MKVRFLVVVASPYPCCQEMEAPQVDLTMIIKNRRLLQKQGRIHGNPVADGCAGAVMRKPLAILEIFVTDGRNDRHGKV